MGIMIGNKIRFAFILVLLCFIPVLIKFKPPEAVTPPTETKIVAEKVATDSGFFFISKDRTYTRVGKLDFMRFLVGDNYTTGWEK